MVIEHGIAIVTATAIIRDTVGEEIARVRVRGAWMGESKLNFVPTTASKGTISAAIHLDFVSIEKHGWSLSYEPASQIAED